MDSRERTFLALGFEQADRVPIDVWMSAGFKRKLKAATDLSFDAFLDLHDVDLRYIDGPVYTGPPLSTFPDGSDEDLWGVRRKIVTVGTGDSVETYKEVVQSPLAHAETVDEINDYNYWPDPDAFDYRPIDAQCQTIRDRGRVVVFMGDRLNRIAQLKPAMYLRGVEQIFMDMTLRPELADAVFARIRSFYNRYAQRIFESANGKLDIVLTGDDFGSQTGPLISPGMWTRFLGDGFAQYAAMAKSYGLRVMHHTCGSVRPIIPLMIDRGLDILQSVQPHTHDMDARELKSEFGDRLAFHGGISIQQTLPFGTQEQVRNEVADIIDALAAGGGCIACTAHNIQADTPITNLQALLDAYKDFG